MVLVLDSSAVKMCYENWSTNDVLCGVHKLYCIMGGLFCATIVQQYVA